MFLVIIKDVIWFFFNVLSVFLRLIIKCCLLKCVIFFLDNNLFFKVLFVLIFNILILNKRIC